MDKKRLERANALDKAIKRLKLDLEKISKIDKINLHSYNESPITLLPTAEGADPDKVFAENIRTTIFEYYKTKLRQLELRLQAL